LLYQRQAPLPGLSGLADLHLGAPLDKALQCCEWEARPLSRAQLHYAAADAVCLLHIVEAMVRLSQPESKRVHLLSLLIPL
jgi:ribonuclease D